MINLGNSLRKATIEDASVMAELVNIAGEGLPFYLWSQMAESNESAWDVGCCRAQREEGGFSYRNTIVREEENNIVACLIGYPLAEQVDPNVYVDMPSMFVPLQELEDLACGTWYVNVLATYPDFRGKGYGSAFLKIAEQTGRELNKKGMSVIVSDANPEARRLYERHGYVEEDRRKMVKEGWENAGEYWTLLLKKF